MIDSNLKSHTCRALWWHQHSISTDYSILFASDDDSILTIPIPIFRLLWTLSTACLDWQLFQAQWLCLIARDRVRWWWGNWNAGRNLKARVKHNSSAHLVEYSSVETWEADMFICALLSANLETGSKGATTPLYSWRAGKYYEHQIDATHSCAGTSCCCVRARIHINLRMCCHQV